MVHISDATTKRDWTRTVTYYALILVERSERITKQISQRAFMHWNRFICEISEDSCNIDWHLGRWGWWGTRELFNGVLRYDLIIDIRTHLMRDIQYSYTDCNAFYSLRSYGIPVVAIFLLMSKSVRGDRSYMVNVSFFIFYFFNSVVSCFLFSLRCLLS